MTSAVKPCKCHRVSGHNVLVRRTHFYFGLPVRLLLLLLLGFIGVAGHTGNFKTTTTNYEDIHHSTFIANQELEFHTDKLLEQSNFSLPKHNTITSAGSHSRHQHLQHGHQPHRFISGETTPSQSNNSLQTEGHKARKKPNKKNSTGKHKAKGRVDEDDDQREGRRFSGGQDFPEGHEFPGGHDFLQGHRSHHSEPLTVAHRLDEEFKESSSVPVVPIQLPPPNDTIHYHYTDDEDSDFYDFVTMSPSSSSKPFSSLNSNKSASPRRSSSPVFIDFDTFEDDEDESETRGPKGRTNSNNKNSLTTRASTKSKSQQSQNSKKHNDNRNRNTPLELEASSSETFPRIYGNREYPKRQKIKKEGSQSKFYRNDPKILYDQSPFHLNRNSQSHDEDHDDQSKQHNYYISKSKKGNELSNRNHHDDGDREFKKTRPNVKQRKLPRQGEERDGSIGDNLDQDPHHQVNGKDDKHFEKSGDESKHVEEVTEFESKKISKIGQNKSSKVVKGTGSLKTIEAKNDPFKGNRAMINGKNTNATSNSLEDLEDDFDFESRDDESSRSLMRRRPRRSVVHLYDMVVCATGCNPLAYKGYGCYCGFLGSGLTVDGIDRCCAKHDWCYHHAKCPPLLTYFVPYYWTCNAGRPKCVTDYRGWKGICGANLCECDRQFAECLRRFPCPRSRAMCMTSPWRNLPIGPNHVFVA